MTGHDPEDGRDPMDAGKAPVLREFFDLPDMATRETSDRRRNGETLSPTWRMPDRLVERHSDPGSARYVHNQWFAMRSLSANGLPVPMPAGACCALDD